MTIWLTQNNMGNLEYWMLEGVGHAPFWEAEGKVNEIIRAWCGKVMRKKGRGPDGKSLNVARL